MIGKIKDMALAALALLSGMLFGLLGWQRSRQARERQKAAESQKDQLKRAYDASEGAGRKGDEKVLEARMRATRGEFDGLDNDR